MRKIYTLLLLCISSFCLAQTTDTDKIVISGNCWGANKTDRNPTSLEEGLKGRVTGLNVQSTTKGVFGDQRIVMRCYRVRSNDTSPMLIVDGIVRKLDTLSRINPNDISSIDILKSAPAVALFGPDGANGIIVVTLKQSSFRKFCVKDFMDGSKIAGATVSFISTDKKDTLMYVANDSGVVVTDKLKPLVQYEINVSAVGYEPVCDLITNIKNEQQINLRRELRTCTEVILKSTGLVRRCGLYCICNTRVIWPDSIGTKCSSGPLIKLFPNPVRKGGVINIETENGKEDRITVKILALDGRLMLNKSVQGLKGASRFQLATDTRWAAGVYIIQLAYANGKILASDKVIIE
ncbi:MAG TPA: TonB-dependent receptor plug domain-containing protein [Chitinophagaceae bacterium]|nr:TonB-dependent receptor plug domain-containing protein [Chitinophagaceae bacterium]